MVYQGNKRRFLKYILPILQSEIDNNNITRYLEPFCGSCSVIEKIRCNFKIANDANKYLIALFNHVVDNNYKPLTPQDFCNKECYDYYKNAAKKRLETRREFDWHGGFLGFITSYSGRFFAGYLQFGNLSNGRDYAQEHLDAFNKQITSDEFKTINYFSCEDYKKINGLGRNSLIYMDPPYRNTTCYGNFEGYDIAELEAWVDFQAKNGAIIYLSEYNSPSDKWEEVWKIDAHVNIARKGNKLIKTERLFKWRG